jgi:hypothetical protein
MNTISGYVKEREREKTLSEEVSDIFFMSYLATRSCICAGESTEKYVLAGLVPYLGN